MIANCSRDRLVVSFSEWQAKNNFICRVYRRSLLLVVESSDDDWLINITFVERHQHEVAFVGNSGSSDVADSQWYPLEQQATVLQAHVATIIVVISGAGVWINFLYDSQISHPNTTQLLTNDFLNCVDDSAQDYSALRLNRPKTYRCREPVKFGNAMCNAPNLENCIE